MCAICVEEVVGIGVQIVPVRPEVVVDDVEHHHQPARMRRVDEGLQIVRRAVGLVRRVEQDAIIAPAAIARELRERHQLDRRDAGLGEVVEPLGRGGKASPRA